MAVKHPASRITLFGVASALFFILGAVLYVLALREHLVSNSFIVWVSMLVQLAFLFFVLSRYLSLLWFSFLGHMEELHAERAEQTPFISIIVPAYNEEKVIEASLESLLQLDYPRYEIVVVDDGSVDRTYAFAQAVARRPTRFPIRVFTKRNGGKSSALNLGIRRAGGELVLCMDGDSTLAPETLRVAAAHFADPNIGAVAGNVKIVNRRNVFTWLQSLEYVEGLNMMRRAQAFFGLVNVIPGPCGVFRRQALLDVGGYPSDTFAEDCDLTLLLLERGWKLAYEPRAMAYTEAPEDLGALLKQRYRWTRGMVQALQKRSGSILARGDVAFRVTLLYMTVEAVLWPAANIMANLFVIGVASSYGLSRVVVFWWMQLTLLDVVAALFCLALEDEDPRLLLYAPLYRVFYVLMMDVCKLIATIEEVLRVPMTWGKLERLGRLG